MFLEGAERGLMSFRLEVGPPFVVQLDKPAPTNEGGEPDQHEEPRIVVQDSVDRMSVAIPEQQWIEVHRRQDHQQCDPHQKNSKSFFLLFRHKRLTFPAPSKNTFS